MFRIQRSRRAAVGAVLAAVVLVAAAGVAYAAIPDSNGVIHGCYDGGGNVKVTAALPCPKGYTNVDWNQTGQQGPPGPGYVFTTATGSPGPTLAANHTYYVEAQFTIKNTTVYDQSGQCGFYGDTGTPPFTQYDGAFYIPAGDLGQVFPYSAIVGVGATPAVLNGGCLRRDPGVTVDYSTIKWFVSPVSISS